MMSADPLLTPSSPSSPIRREIGQVFLPVRDLRAAAEWYAELLGAETAPPAHGDTIVDIPMSAGPALSLDANAPFTADGPPRFFWWADDMDAVLGHLERLGIPLVLGPLDIGSVELVHFRDPEGNLLMVCVRGPRGTRAAESASSGGVESGMSRSMN